MNLLRKGAKRIKQSLLAHSFNLHPQSNDALLFAVGQAGISANRNRYDHVCSLWDIDYRVFSQFGDDGIIDFLCSRLLLHKPVFIEIGTGDYVESNTRFLYQLRTTKGLIIDCDPSLAEESQGRLGSFFWKGEFIPRSAFVTLDNVRSLIHGFEDSDLLSLDIDGNDYWVLSVLLRDLQPKILIVEFNAYFGSQEAVTTPYDPNFVRSHYHYSHLVFGASLKAFCCLTSTNYCFLGTNLHCNNAYFIRRDFVHFLPVSFHMPDPEFLDEFTQNFTREARNENGSLSFVTHTTRLNIIKESILVDLSSNPPEERSVADIYGI
jgi:hypothetical protein